MVKSNPIPRERVGKALHKAGLSEMPYGYLLRNPGEARAQGRTYELAMAGAGISVAVSVVTLILMPALWAMDGGTMLHVATSITLLSLSMLLLRNASRGNLMDAEIDFGKDEVRIVRRNARGQAKVISRVPFDQVRSIFVQRSKARASSTNALCMHVVGGDRAYKLVRGSDEAMSTLHRRLVRDINNVVVAGKATRLASGDRALELSQAAEAAKAGLTAA